MIVRLVKHALNNISLWFFILLTGFAIFSCGSSKTTNLDYNISGTNHYSDSAEKVLDLVNKTRAKKNLAPLARNHLLTTMAQAWSEAMARDGFCSHVHPKKRDLDLKNRLILFNRDRVKKGLSLLKLDHISENVGFSADGSLSEKEHVRTVWKGFMKSRSHKNNILSKSSSIIGIGITRGKYKGIPAYFITQIFGRGSQHPNHFIGSDAL